MPEGNFEREIPISNFVGLEQEEKDKAENQFKEIFLSQEVFDEEREKTPEEKEILGKILGKMPAFIEKYGGKHVALAQIGHIHFVNRDELQKALGSKSSDGAYNPIAQTIYVGDQKNVLQNMHASCHELLHLNSFQSLWFRENESEAEKVFQQRRMGFEIHDRDDGDTIYFFDINEAITEELNIRFQQENFSGIEGIAREREKRKNNIEDMPPLARDMLKAIREKQEKGAYQSERNKLNEVIDRIYSENSSSYESREDVFDEFAKAYFTGNLLTVARLIEGAFGKGSFRKLGEETEKQLK